MYVLSSDEAKMFAFPYPEASAMHRSDEICNFVLHQIHRDRKTADAPPEGIIHCISDVQH